jgi:CO/xanthine dehydrogenase Mo-binding subunit
MEPTWVGRSVPRAEAGAKARGIARYAADLRMPGMWHGVTVRSTIASGRIRGIHLDPAFPWAECAVVDAAAIAGRNVIAHILDDQPCLANGRVNHVEEAVLLIAHPERAVAEAARRHVRIEYAPEPAVLTIDEALRAGCLFKSMDIDQGDVDAALSAAFRVVEGAYETGPQEHVYLEPQAMLALWADGGVTVWGSMQCPYYVQHALMGVFALPASDVRVVQCETGGGFGGKEDYPSVVAAHAALLAWKCGHPVKIVYDRAEDMAATTKRHPARIRHRTGLDAEGHLVAMDIDITLDGGAYSTMSPVVLSRAALHACGVYRCPNVRVRARAVATNHVPRGAFRGFGAPQVLFAVERQMDRAARALGLDPVELRRRNFLRTGDAMATGQLMREPLDLDALMERALVAGRYHERRGHGVGVAVVLHGGGFTGSGERFLASEVAVEATSEGRARVLVSSCEIGQGSSTVLRQIAADALQVDLDDVEMARPDTARVPDSGPTVASRTSMVVGKLVERAALGLRARLEAAGLLDGRLFADACREYLALHGELCAESRYQPPPGIVWDEEHARGDAYATYSWAVNLAAVQIDPVTFETNVTDFVAVVDAGRILNPTLAIGQVEGGVAQALGWALSEEVVEENGRMLNARMSDYAMPTSADSLDIQVIFVETPYEHGPGGAKGLGELPMDGPAPAVLNAIEDAAGVSLCRLPATPERLLEAWEASRG